MPGYSYIAVDKKGKEKRGKMEADSREKLAEILKNDGLIPVSIKDQGLFNKELDFSIGKKVKPRDLSIFCRQFVSIMQAGVPMKEALQMLSEQTENMMLKKSITEVLSSVEKGNTLADAMRGEGHSFPTMLINMVEAGESSGNLDMAFSRMAIHFEKDAKLRGTIKKATIYPIILVLAAIAVIIIMLTYVIPIFIDMFEDIDIEMPAFTMAVMNASKWMTGHWYIVVGAVVGIAALYQIIYRTASGRSQIDLIKMKAPLFGKLTVKTACAQFARTTSTLLAAGIPMIECLETVSKIINNVHFKKALMDSREEVMKGIPLSEPLQASKIFPPMVYHMTGIGEETGNIEDMMEKMADYYDEEVEITTQSVMAAMEPIIIVFMALVVGVLVIAVVSPIGAMYSGLDNL